jgi:hypothetical protein
VRAGDEFCESCGAAVGPELKRALRDRLEASDSSAAERAKLVKSASGTILALSVLFVIGGVVFYFLSESKVDEALRNIATLDDAQRLATPVAGAETVGELRERIRREPTQLLVINLILATIMAGLYVWSKRAVLAAVITALGIYVVVQVVSALIDPATLAQGIIMKIIIIAALVKGVKAAIDSRALEVAR